jgi:hypothetical protein
MYALLSLPPSVLPNAFLYVIAFASVLAVVLALIAIFPLLRKKQLALILLPIGYVEFVTLFNPRYNASLVGFVIVLVTIISGIVIPIFYATRKLFSKTPVKLLLVLTGGVYFLAIGAAALLIKPKETPN